MRRFPLYRILALVALVLFIAFWALVIWDYFYVYLANPWYSASFDVYILTRGAQCLLPAALCFAGALILKNRHS